MFVWGFVLSRDAHTREHHSTISMREVGKAAALYIEDASGTLRSAGNATWVQPAMSGGETRHATLHVFSTWCSPGVVLVAVVGLVRLP